jgi:hypothetical protein
VYTVYYSTIHYGVYSKHRPCILCILLYYDITILYILYALYTLYTLYTLYIVHYTHSVDTTTPFFGNPKTLTVLSLDSNSEVRMIIIVMIDTIVYDVY